MTRKQLSNSRQKLFQRCIEISTAKSHDYAGTYPFKNFKLVDFWAYALLRWGS